VCAVLTFSRKKRYGILLNQRVGRDQGGFFLGCLSQGFAVTAVDELLGQELSSLQPLLAQEVEREALEGPGHTGPSAVVQWIGRKL